MKLLVNLRGDGTGSTTYLQGYRFEVRSSHAFTLASTGAIELRTILYEKAPISTKFEERPAVRYAIKTRPPLTDSAVTPPQMSLPKPP